MGWWSDKPTQPPAGPKPQPERGLGRPDDGYHCKWQLPVVVELTGCSPYEGEAHKNEM